ncbi:MAG: hypothetical protein ACRBBR_14125 [Cellvibrionaceae bacterium]
MYTQLSFTEIIKTISCLELRIIERMPDSDIAQVCKELHSTANHAQQRVRTLSTPNKWIRGSVIAVVIVFSSVLIYTLSLFEWEFSKPTLAEMIQITEALINDIILLGAALFFLLTLEQRLQRRSVLQELHQLRSIAHLVDMHQLTKDPSMINSQEQQTEHSPERNMTQFQLQRYLDYCSEMFSLIGKIAALYSERFPDTEIVAAANDIEDLCTGLSRKVWQKLYFIEGTP